MSGKTDGGVKPSPKRERSVADVAREAFEKRLFEGDEAKAKSHRPSPVPSS